MNLTIQREALLEPLQKVIGVVERRQTLPILANVLLSVDDQQLSITATDLEVELIGRAQLAQPAKESAQITVPGRKLFDICRTLPDQAMIDLQKDKERVILRSGRSRFILATLPIESFPNFEENKNGVELAITQKDLNTLLHRTHFAMAQQDVRYYLNGMLLEINSGIIRTVATDGHRLSMSMTNTSFTNDSASQVIIPRKGIIELMRLLSNEDASVTATIMDNQVRIKGDTFTFTSKLIDGRFPDYEKVLPKGGNKSVIIERDVLREALMRASILSNEKFRGIRLQLRSGLLRILANNPEQEEAEEIIHTDYEGEELDIGFNVLYLLDILNTIEPGKVKLTFIDSNSSMLVEEVDGGTNSLFVVMPLRL